MNKLSIIIPVLNEAEIIAARLADLQCLRKQGAEVILVDGGSSDATLTRAEGLVDRVLHSARGRAVQMSAGAEAASGKMLWFLHADTVVSQAVIEGLLSRLKDLRSGWGFFRVRMSSRRWLLKLVARMMNLRSRLTSVATGDQGLFIAKDLYQRVGGFDDMPLMEDVAMSKKLRAVARPLVMPGPVTISTRKWESEGVIKTILLMWRLRLLYFFGVSPARLVKQYYRK